jgi:hypothetical protein
MGLWKEKEMLPEGSTPWRGKRLDAVSALSEMGYSGDQVGPFLGVVTSALMALVVSEVLSNLSKCI